MPVIDIIIGPMSNTVVTLSKKADNTAVTMVNMNIIFQGSPLAILAVLIDIYSNKPEHFITATNTIMPTSTPMVLKSI